jgi:hypothetical protein
MAKNVSSILREAALPFDVVTAGGRAILIDFLPRYDYSGGKRGDLPVGNTAQIVIPRNDFMHLSVKLPFGTLTPEDFKNLKESAGVDGEILVDFQDFSASPYTGPDGRLALSCSASAMTVTPISDYGVTDKVRSKEGKEG